MPQEFLKINNVFFQSSVEGFQVVSDPNVLVGLFGGTTQFTEQTPTNVSFAPGSQLFGEPTQPVTPPPEPVPAPTPTPTPTVTPTTAPPSPTGQPPPPIPTAPQLQVGQFFKSGGTFFEQGPSGLQIVGDIETVRKLLEGTIEFSPLPEAQTATLIGGVSVIDVIPGRRQPGAPAVVTPTVEQAIALGAQEGEVFTFQGRQFRFTPTGIIPVTTQQEQIGLLPIDVEPTPVELDMNGVAGQDEFEDAISGGLTQFDISSVFGGLLKDLQTSRQDIQMARQRAAELQQQERLGQIQISGQAIPQPLIGAQALQLEQQIATRAIPLQIELNRLEQAKGNILETIDIAIQLQQLTRPDVLSTQISADGTVNIVVRKPDGTFGIETAGNIGPQAATDLSEAVFKQIFTNPETGEATFIGILPDGTQVNIPLGVQGEAKSIEFSKARKIIEDNVSLSDVELKSILFEQTKLGVSEINNLLAGRLTRIELENAVKRIVASLFTKRIGFTRGVELKKAQEKAITQLEDFENIVNIDGDEFVLNAAQQEIYRNTVNEITADEALRIKALLQ